MHTASVYRIPLYIHNIGLSVHRDLAAVYTYTKMQNECGTVSYAYFAHTVDTPAMTTLIPKTHAQSGAEEAVFQWSGQRLLKAAAVGWVEGTGPSEKSGGCPPENVEI